jgi:hypothetical protein
VFVNLGVAKVSPGVQNLPLSGNVQSGVSVLVGLEDDVGHWIVPAPIKDALEKDSYQFSTRMSFSPELPAGTQKLIFRGVAEDGRSGRPSSTCSPSPRRCRPARWSSPSPGHPGRPGPARRRPEPGARSGHGRAGRADRDLVAQPGRPAAHHLPPTPEEMQAALKAAGRFDFDSNSGCVIDGRRQENVIFTEPPPDGEYIVRVDTFSLCGQASAQWQVTVTNADGAVVNPATWQAIDADAARAARPRRGTAGAALHAPALTQRRKGKP